MNKIVILLAVFGLALAAAAAPPSPPKGFQWKANPDYTDEFDGTRLDAKKWYDHHPQWEGRPPALFVPKNISVGDGMLRLSNSVLSRPQGKFTLGGSAVVSKKTTALFGYYECRLKASDISMSSTFWMSNSGHPYEGIGKVAQELDILETVGNCKNHPEFAFFMNSNTHVWLNGKSRKVGNKARLPCRASEDFQVYGAWWVDANTVRFYLNDVFVGEVAVDTSLIPHPFEHPMHINLVTETYGWEEPPTPEEISDPSRNTTLIDWIRAYTLHPSDDSMADCRLLRDGPRDLFSQQPPNHPILSASILPVDTSGAVFDFVSFPSGGFRQ